MKNSFLVGFVLALLLAGGVFAYFVYTDDEEQPVAVISDVFDSEDEDDDDTDEDIEVVFDDSLDVAEPQTEGRLFTNTEEGYSIIIPDGYVTNEFNAREVIVASEPTDELTGGFAEFTITTQDGSLASYTEDLLVDGGEYTITDITVNDLTGQVFASEGEIAPGIVGTCERTVLEHNKKVSEFFEWECLESSVMDGVINSFQVVE